MKKRLFRVILVLMVLPVIFAGLYSILTWFILDKRLNLE